MSIARSASISPPPAKRRRVFRDDTQHQADGAGGDTTSATTNIHTAPQSPPQSWLRIYSWNINGISPFLQPTMASFFKRKAGESQSSDESSLASLRQVLKRFHWPQLLFLQEVKINPEDDSIKRAVERAVNKPLSSDDEGPTYKVRFCLPKDKYNARGFGRKVYGVASIIRDDFLEDFVEQIREVAWDLEGRVSLVQTKHKLAIFNIYAVNGTDNPYKDPQTGIPSGTRHDRKLAFHRQLMEEGKRLEQAGYRLVIAGDINVAPARIDGHPNLRTRPQQHVKNREDFHKRFLSLPSEEEPGLALVDSFRHLHPQEKKYSWTSRTKEWLSSCDRVDLVLVSSSLVASGALKEADICMTLVDRGPSDHCPIYVSIEL